MKYLINTIRIFVGVLFIFSGLVKANDPAGLSYKMHEFFDAWNMQGLNSYALIFAVLMIGFEIIAGFALLIGWQKRLNLWLLFVLIIFFTFLTGYAMYARDAAGNLKFKSCGCFGDCIPLKPVQSFWKDIILAVCIIVLLVFQKYIQPIFKKNIFNAAALVAVIAFSFLIQKYTLDHLPFKDCLSFKVGNNLLEKRKYIPDSTVITTFCKNIKDGKYYSFDSPDYPDWYTNDSIGQYVEDSTKTISRTIREGNKNDIIRDFSLKSNAENDTTDAILSMEQPILLLLINEIKIAGKYDWENSFQKLLKHYEVNSSAESKMPKLFIVTNYKEEAKQFFAKYKVSAEHIFFCDEKPLLAAARTRPAIMRLEKSVVKAKYAYKDWSKLIP